MDEHITYYQCKSCKEKFIITDKLKYNKGTRYAN